MIESADQERSYLIVKHKPILQNPSSFNKLSNFWIVSGGIDFFCSLLELKQNLLKLSVRNRVIASRGVLAKVLKEQRILANPLDRLGGSTLARSVCLHILKTRLD
jgi:hypothetical protein